MTERVHEPAQRGDLVVVFDVTRMPQINGPTITFERFRLGTVKSLTRQGLPSKWIEAGGAKIDPIPQPLSVMVFPQAKYDVLAILTATDDVHHIIDRDALRPLLDAHRLDLPDLDTEEKK